MTSAGSATRAREFNWINQLDLPQKKLLNDLVRLGCLVRASSQLDDAVRVTVTFRSVMISEAFAPHVAEALLAVHADVQKVLFGEQQGVRGG